MPGAQHPGRNALLHRGRQVKQAERVGNVRARTADLLRQLLVRRAEIIEKLLVCGGFLQRVELLAVQVLDQGVAQEVGVGDFPDDRGDQLEVGALTGPPSALTHDQFVAAGHHLADHDRLKEADLADGRRELVQRFLVERSPWLTRVGGDRAGGYFFEVGYGDRRGSRRAIVGGRGGPLIRCECASGLCGGLGLARPRPGPHRRRDKRTESLAESAPLLSHRISLIRAQPTHSLSCQVRRVRQHRSRHADRPVVRRGQHNRPGSGTGSAPRTRSRRHAQTPPPDA